MIHLNIKRIFAADALLLSKVAIEAYSDHYLHLWYDNGEWYIKKYFSPETLLKELNEENAHFYIAYLNESPAGFIKLNINAPVEGMRDKDALELQRIYLNKKAAGKGVGSKLVTLALTIAKENRKDLVWLKAMDSSKRAIDFYKKMGFQISGTHHLKHPLMKEGLRGMVIMVQAIQYA